ncbi:MAG: metalloregulator ArsR/SmtB family transcription factor [Actinobacteria bacterium]|nr:metalloregulator ArsR/SmtB family transcription factor [Actinomycetota bacterium]
MKGEPVLLQEQERTALMARLYRGFADGSRLSILQALDGEGALTVTEIVERTGLGQSNASNHLACLRECGLVRAEQQGRYVRYDLADDRVQELLRLAESLLEEIGGQIYACTRYRSADAV